MRSEDVAKGVVRSCTKAHLTNSSERTGELMKVLNVIAYLLMLPIRFMFWSVVIVLKALSEAD